jgi:integrase
MSVKGSIHRRSPKGTLAANTVWTLRVELPRLATDPLKRRSKATTFKGPYRDAQEALAKLVAESQEGVSIRGEITFNKLFDIWQRQPRAVTTRDHDKLRYDTWIRKKFGSRVVDDVTPEELKEFFERIRTTTSESALKKFYKEIRPNVPKHPKPISINSTIRLYSLMAAMTNYGYREQLISSKPMDHVKKMREVVLPPRAPTKENVDQLLEYLWERDKTMWLAVRLCATLGLRRSELGGLRWSDFLVGRVMQEGSNATLRIQRGIVANPAGRKRKLGEPSYIVTGTKTGAQSHRDLPLDEKLRDAIAEMYVPAKTNHFVFSEPKTGHIPWNPDTLNRKLDKARKEAYVDHPELGFVRITFMSLRIYCASRVYLTGGDVRMARAVLGHQTTKTTDRYYIAFQDETMRKATVTVGNEFAH